jgi:hypothetical protein
VNGVLLRLVIVAAVVAGCADSSERDPVVVPATASGPPASEPSLELAPTGAPDGVGDGPAPPNARRPMLGSDLDQDAILAHLAEARVVVLEPVGTSSVVFRARLDAPIQAALKPASMVHPKGELAEVAAYRLARLLELDDVPPVVSRRFHMDEVRARLHPRFADRWPEIERWVRWDGEGRARFAVIYWIPQMRDLEIDTPAGLGRLRRWLRQGQRFPYAETWLVRDASTMIAFDYLVANWDRWSGGNAQGSIEPRRLFIRDHNAAFVAPLQASVHARVEEHLRRVERFSRGFVERVRALDEASLTRELALDGGESALNDLQRRELLARRRRLVAYVDALIGAYGESEVLCFE